MNTHVRIATGSAGERSYITAELQRRFAATRGVEVEIIPTDGSIDVMRMVQAGEAESGLVLKASSHVLDCEK